MGRGVGVAAAATAAGMLGQGSRRRCVFGTGPAGRVTQAGGAGNGHEGVGSLAILPPRAERAAGLGYRRAARKRYLKKGGHAVGCRPWSRGGRGGADKGRDPEEKKASVHHQRKGQPLASAAMKGVRRNITTCVR